MAGWRIFAAIVLAVLLPVLCALFVYQVCKWLSYDIAAIYVFMKGLTFLVVTFLLSTSVVLFFQGLIRARHH